MKRLQQAGTIANYLSLGASISGTILAMVVTDPSVSIIASSIAGSINALIGNAAEGLKFYRKCDALINNKSGHELEKNAKAEFQEENNKKISSFNFINFIARTTSAVFSLSFIILAIAFLSSSPTASKILLLLSTIILSSLAIGAKVFENYTIRNAEKQLKAKIQKINNNMADDYKKITKKLEVQSKIAKKHSEKELSIMDKIYNLNKSKRHTQNLLDILEKMIFENKLDDFDFLLDKKDIHELLSLDTIDIFLSLEEAKIDEIKLNSNIYNILYREMIPISTLKLLTKDNIDDVNRLKNVSDAKEKVEELIKKDTFSENNSIEIHENISMEKR